MSKQKIQFGSRVIEFDLVYSKRKSLAITVTPTLKILIKAPLNASMEKIKEKVKGKAPWIFKQQNYFLSFEPRTPARKYVSGETHFYGGKKFRLIVKQAKTESVKLKDGYIIINTMRKEDARHILEEWYKTKAKEMFPKYTTEIIKKFPTLNVMPKSIVIRNMKTRWGSCTNHNKIILNPQLIMAPKGCVEYVIAHELCHLKYRNHNSKFYTLLNSIIKDSEKWKIKLERIMA